MTPWEQGLLELGWSLTGEQIRQFQRYEELLLAWNERFNLTAVRSPEGIRTRHFLDSLTCVSATGDLSGQSLIDVGAGAGFPGLPLKILFPDLSLTLVESATKKAAFLEAVTADLALANVRVVTARAEDLGQDPAFRERYDWAAARAVAPLHVLLEYLLPLVRLGGQALAQKGQQAESELAAAQNALQVLGGGEVELLPVRLPGQMDAAYLVNVRKLWPTPVMYPRRAGMPAKRPL